MYDNNQLLRDYATALLIDSLGKGNNSEWMYKGFVCMVAGKAKRAFKIRHKMSATRSRSCVS